MPAGALDRRGAPAHGHERPPWPAAARRRRARAAREPADPDRPQQQRGAGRETPRESTRRRRRSPGRAAAPGAAALIQTSPASHGSASPAPIAKRAAIQAGTLCTACIAAIASAASAQPAAMARTAPSRATTGGSTGIKSRIATGDMAPASPIVQSALPHDSSVSEVSGNRIPRVRPTPAMCSVTAHSTATSGASDAVRERPARSPRTTESMGACPGRKGGAFARRP